MQNCKTPQTTSLSSEKTPAEKSPWYTDLTILCKVVDNFGDIGFVYRLARALSECDPSVRLRIIVSDLASFKAMAREIDEKAPVQDHQGWKIFDWNNDQACTEEFSKNPPHTIIECFQCNRPEWLDTLLFDRQLANENHIVRILNIDYLTAEDYAEEFHCLKSGTRSQFVKKWNFMSGFTPKTAGLTLDKDWMKSIACRKVNFELDEDSLADLEDDQTFCVTIFAYERDFAPLVRALKKLPKKVRAFVAAGKSREPFLRAWKEEGMPFAITELPFLEQSQWDSLLCAVDWNFVRGEDSLSRACLAKVPFIWHAYPQETEYQLVKVKALLDRMEGHFDAADFAPIKRLFISYNKDQEDPASQADFTAVFENAEKLTASFRAFSDSLYQIGNLADHLLSYLELNEKNR